MTETLYLVDASGYIFRAYYAIRPLTNSKGLPTNALYGFTSMLLKLIQEKKPDHIACVFDVARKTFRNEKYPAYKANRDETPEDLVPQFPYFRKIVQALNIPVLELPNYEADDVIGTVAKNMSRKKLKTVIVTGDKDLMQLVTDKVELFDSMKEKEIRAEQVLEKFGVKPEQVADVLGLAGDASDNIPGLPGIGEKTAIKLIQQFGSIENIYKKLGPGDGLTDKLREKLKIHEKEAYLYRELATIVTDAPLEYDFKDFALGAPDPEKMKTLFEELEFKRFLLEMGSSPTPPQKTLPKKDYHLILQRDDWEKLLGQLRDSGGFAIDLETTSVNPMEASIVGLSFSTKPGEGSYVPVGHTKASMQLLKEKVLDDLKPILLDPSIPKFGQNLKYDLTILRRYGMEVAGTLCDTMLASYLLKPEGQHNMQLLAQEYLGHQVTTYKDVVGTGQKEINFSEVDLSTACEYSCEDADVTYRLHQLLVPKLKQEGLDTLFLEMEMPLLKVLMTMEMNGVLIDPQALQAISKEYEGKMATLEERIHGLAGGPFNINSPKQLQAILFDKLQLSPLRKTKTGFSTDVDVLEKLAKKHELPLHLLQYRTLSKLKSTYIDALPALIDKKTGRIHTSFNQTIAATGRLTSTEPNLQNIPARTEEGRRIREAFIPAPGCQLLSADYSQIELRLLAHISEDQALIQAFHDDADIHSATAAMIFNVIPGLVTDDQRSIGKTVNFGVVYGQSAYSLSQQLGIPMGEAASYIDNYYKQYKGVALCKEKILAEARHSKRIKTLFGRIRNFPEIDSRNQNLRQYAERTAFNTVFQGTAADIIKRAMITIQDQLVKGNFKTKMILQVHDELVFEVPDSELDRLKEMVVKEMSGAAELKVPLKVDVGVGKNWAEAH